MHVGVFVNEPPENIAAIIKSCSLDLVQLCGDESKEELKQLGQRAFKAVRPKFIEDGDDLAQSFVRDDAPKQKRRRILFDGLYLLLIELQPQRP